MNTNSVIKQDKLLKVNQQVLLAGGSIYGLLYLFSAQFILGLGIIAVSAGLVYFVNIAKKKIAGDFTVYLITFAQYIIITAFGIITFEVIGSFTLIISAILMNSLYYNKKIVIIQWIATDIVMLICFIFKDVFFQGISSSVILRGLLGLNFALLFLTFLLTWGVASLNDAQEKTIKADELVDEVNKKMLENKEQTEKQKEIFNNIKTRSDNLNLTSNNMLEVAKDLSESSQAQEFVLSELANQGHVVMSEINTAKDKAQESKEIAVNSAQRLKENNDNMIKIVDAINDIEKSSEKIISIIKNIEDIAFQTNILALNASIEAARAGTAGRGFAVVADEVRNLAVKSSAAASDSASLVNNSIRSVKFGASLVKETADNMGKVIEYSDAAAENAQVIDELMVEQVENVKNMLDRMEEIAAAIERTSRTAEESNNLANEVSHEIGYINSAIR